MGRRPSDARERILAAAEQIAVRDGAAQLTLDAVAAETGLSKGGVLYHFSTKDALLTGLVEKFTLDAERAMEALLDEDPEPGRFTRAFLKTTLPADFQRAVHSLVAIVAQNPALLAPMRACYERWQERIAQDGIDPVDATLVRLASDGLWMNEIFALPPLDPALHAAVVKRLEELTRARKARG